MDGTDETVSESAGGIEMEEAQMPAAAGMTYGFCFRFPLSRFSLSAAQQSMSDQMPICDYQVCPTPNGSHQWRFSFLLLVGSLVFLSTTMAW